MKKILTTLKEKWAEYLLEILVIFISIIAAFILDAWHDKNVEKGHLIAILKKAQLDIQEKINGLEGQVNGYKNHLDTTFIALSILEDPPQKLSEDQEHILSNAFSRVMILGSRNYDQRSLELLVESLPVTEPNLDLINAINGLIERIIGGTDLINDFHSHLFLKEAQLDKNIFWFDKNGAVKYDYEALKDSRQTIDYLVRGYRWKNWTRYFENNMVTDYKMVSDLIEKQLKELEE